MDLRSRDAGAVDAGTFDAGEKHAREQDAGSSAVDRNDAGARDAGNRGSRPVDAVEGERGATAAGGDAGSGDAGTPERPRRIVPNPLSRKVDEERVERVFQSLEPRARAAQLLLAYPQIGKGAVEVGGVVFVGNSLKNIGAATEKIARSGRGRRFRRCSRWTWRAARRTG